MATYTKPTISNYNDNPPSNDGSTNFTDNGVDWDRHIDEIGDPLNNYADSINNATSLAFTSIDEAVINVKTVYGATGDGVADDSSAFNNAFTALSTTGGVLMVPPGTYLFSSQVTATTTTNSKVLVIGYGAEIITDAAISGLKITSSGTNGGVTIQGLEINHRGNATATNGFEIVSAWSTQLIDCTIETHDTQSGYACIKVTTSDPTDTTLGSFWTKLIRCRIRPRSGSDGTDPDYGILLESNANATQIMSCDIFACTECITLKDKDAVVTVPNGVLIHGTTFEGFTSAVRIDAAATTILLGPRIIGCRAEDGTNFLNITGTTVASDTVAPYLAGNLNISDVTNYIVNTNNVGVNSLDMMITPDIGDGYPNGGMSWKQNTTIESEDGSTTGLTVVTVGANRGIKVENTSGDVAVQMLWKSGTSTAAIGSIQSQNSNGLELNQIRGISFSSLAAANIRGSETLSGGVGVVTFANAEADASYYITLGGDTNETFRWLLKTANGFSISSSNGSSTATVDWILIR